MLKIESLAAGAGGSQAFLYVGLFCASLSITCICVWAYTTWSYHRSIEFIRNLPSKPGKHTVEPAQIPYIFPGLGHTFSFILGTKPGAFWQKLFSWHPRSSGACTLVIGGIKTHILYTPHVMAAMFKEKTLKRDVFERVLYSTALRMSPEQQRNAMEGRHFEHEVNVAYLTRAQCVNELTRDFMRVLDDVLCKDATEIVQKESIGLYEWLRDRMFTASTTALFGEEFLKYYPDFSADFWQFDSHFLTWFFQLPDFLMRDANKVRDRMLAKVEIWSRAMHEKSGGAPVDPDGPAWEPLMGSRLNRARQNSYRDRNFDSKTGALLDIGVTFALSSNVIPITGWMLMHILDPKGDPSLPGRVMTELEQAQRPDGSVDVPTLIMLPLLQSIWTETLRLYTDVLVPRNVTEDIALPLDEDGKTFIQLRKGDNVFAPSIIGHMDPEVWADDRAPVDVFYADRFLQLDPENPDKQIFVPKGTDKMYPFGGGRSLCPGRVFAKQEALGALAMVLLRFEFDVMGYMDDKRKPTPEFVQPALVFPGSAGLAPGGDMKVRIRQRK